MLRPRLKSSNLESVGYDTETMTLEVEFKSRAVYQHYAVPAAVYAGLMRACSKGHT
jgi:hypothetical protein